VTFVPGPVLLDVLVRSRPAMVMPGVPAPLASVEAGDIRAGLVVGAFVFVGG
jgi:hypothetical protein